jgi:hypothetical protein
MLYFWHANSIVDYYSYSTPPNTTSVIQPFDQGIIRVFKANYRYLLGKFYVRKLDIKDDLVMPNIK